jgi:hypothetical protein
MKPHDRILDKLLKTFENFLLNFNKARITLFYKRKNKYFEPGKYEMGCDFLF